MRLVICTPSRGQTSLGYRDLFSSIKLMCHERELDFDVFDDTTDGEKHQSRNLLLFRVAEELEEGDWAYWLDADVAHHPQLLFELLPRDEEIIAKAYPIRPAEDSTPEWSAHPLTDKRNGVVWSEDRRLVEARSHGFGSVLMKATAAKALREKYGVIGRGGRGRRSVPAFDLRVDNWSTLCGEDVSFCARWREEMGRQLWVAPNGYVRNGQHGGVYEEALNGY